jgi:hypothetical protein
MLGNTIKPPTATGDETGPPTQAKQKTPMPSLKKVEFLTKDLKEQSSND